MSILSYLKQLHQNRRELVLLEAAYLLIAILSFLLAGSIALFNQPLGNSFLIIPLVAFVAFSTNIIAWALVKLFVEAIPGKTSLRSNIKQNSSNKAKTTAKKS